MQYELYIDIFFLENFMADYLILLAIKKALSCTATHGRLLAGAFAGASGACLVLCVPLPAYVRLFALYIPIYTCMLIIGLKIRSLKIFLKASILGYLISFLLGGIMSWLGQYAGGYFKTGSLFFVLAACSYFLLSKGMAFLERFWKLRELRCSATLCLDGRTCELNAIIDSGNMLSDPLTGKPVHIISRQAALRLAGSQAISHVRYIPYRTIQKGNGVLPVIQIDRLWICFEKKEPRLIESPLIGISEQNRFDNGNYEIILHPEDC